MTSWPSKGSIIINVGVSAFLVRVTAPRSELRFTELKAILSYGTPNQLGPKGA